MMALATTTPRVRCIVRNEVAGVDYDPYAIGALGERGVAQLASFGKLPEFYRLGYSEPENPYEAVRYLQWALEHDQEWAWTSVKMGVC